MDDSILIPIESLASSKNISTITSSCAEQVSDASRLPEQSKIPGPQEYRKLLSIGCSPWQTPGHDTGADHTGLAPDRPSIQAQTHLNGFKYAHRVIAGHRSCVQDVHIYVT